MATKTFLRQNGLMVKATDCPVCSRPHEIIVGKNAGKYKTRLSSCEEFRNMSIQERSTAMERAQACVRCTDWTHKKSNCDAKFGNKPWQDCTVLDGAGKKCGKKHHNLLHGSNNAYICNMFMGASRRVNTTSNLSVFEAT